jgi:hypothetical protein
VPKFLSLKLLANGIFRNGSCVWASKFALTHAGSSVVMRGCLARRDDVSRMFPKFVDGSFVESFVVLFACNTRLR